NTLPNFPATWNLPPTQDGLVVRRHPETGARHLDALRWGLVPRWATAPSVSARMINARAESVAERPACADGIRKRGCLVPADRSGVARAGGARMALAGLW